jgi:hypothetical protein
MHTILFLDGFTSVMQHSHTLRVAVLLAAFDFPRFVCSGVDELQET